MEIIKGFISPEDVTTIQEYIKTVKFNTKEDHVPLHDALYEEFNAPFDLHTRGEMPKHILDIFSKYSKGFYDIIESITPSEYMPPMFSKHYIARYNPGTETGPQFDKSKPEGTYKSFIFWNNDFEGGELFFPGISKMFKPEPGDLVFFIESEENRCSITKIISGPLYLSEAWIGKRGQLWMPSKDPYDRIDWDNWEIKGF
jgi:hypothetical protein